ncbi:hypothetical protein I7I51_04549 [Histoplasma capsulatum]|uniref:Small ribosomal subunit protein mS41 n=1 Tax=Ajellomyces capsulatus TaxID=5037 RepID=A0A8A1M8R9_AJECA|nr:conserved hypothetical protein [Histoplasma mississippiense (nom. inval.)]EDN07537.1 conserved hypothetical protein [Histoplasma mississippiense (nom. inval.)]QSS62371.1 hypothetical protein I7I51_04549 [Histoplasma capsulatum]
MAARTIPLKPCSPRPLTTFHTSRWHFSFFSPSHQFLRRLHRSSQLRVPPPTPFVPDTQTFLSLIGRNMSRFAPKFASWDELFTLSSADLKDRGIEPARLRRYLLRWRQKFQRGEYGVGGDLEHVVDGVGQLRVVEVPRDTVLKRTAGKNSTPTATDGGLGKREIPPFTVTGTATLSPGMKWVVVNLPPGESQPTEVPQPLKKYTKVSLVRGNVLRAPYLKLIKGSNGMAGIIKVQEGMWEDKQGRKIDGGERRQAEFHNSIITIT